MSVCRGCAGTGLRYDMPGVAIQVAGQPIVVPAWDGHVMRMIPGVGADSVNRVLTATKGATKRRWSAMDVLRTYQHLVALGAKPPRPLNFAAADLCSWCAGLGVPGRLTAHALKTAIEEAR